jgi:PAT family beta-lactamase induction signal transducer AmpG
VEIERDRGVGSSAIQLGYRLGMLISGAGAIYLSVFFQWSQVFQIMASLMLVGSITVFLSPKSPEDSQKNISSTEGTFNFVKEWFLQNVLEPFREFITRRFSFTIIIFIILYKLGDAVLGVMANPFYIEIGFSAQQIATASKVFGSLATIAGVIVGGLLTSSIGIFKSLLICGVLQALSNLMFVFQSIVGNDFSILFLTIGIENLSGGMGAAAFVAFLSSLCNRSHIITQYALLTSLMAFGRTTLSATGGWLADHLSWPIFFLLSSFLAIPGLLILLLLMRKIRLFLPDKTNQI